MERHERAELATFIPFAMLELSIILFVLCGIIYYSVCLMWTIADCSYVFKASLRRRLGVEALPLRFGKSTALGA